MKPHRDEPFLREIRLYGRSTGEPGAYDRNEHARIVGLQFKAAFDVILTALRND